MSTERPVQSFCVTAILLAAAGCGGSTNDVPDAGGTTSLPGSGGHGANGSGGSGGSGGTVPNNGSGGTVATGGSGASGGTGNVANGTGGSVAGTSGSNATGGAGASGGVNTGGASGTTAGASAVEGGRGGRGGGSGGRQNTAGGGMGGAGVAGAAGRAMTSGGASGTGGMSSGTCTASKAAGSNASGTGPHKVTVETNADTGIKEGTIFRPTDLGGDEKYPIFVWGEGGCSENGLSNSAAMGEIASHGYFVIADGVPNGSASRSQTNDVVAMGKPLIAYIDWAIAENEKPCSAYYHALDTTKIAANGFSCGGLMSEGTAADPRITTFGINSSGTLSSSNAFYMSVHTPVLVVLGGSGDVAYQNGERDYDNISKLGKQPIMLFSKALGHGGDLFSSHGGDFTKIDVAWLNWWLKGDEGATGKGVLVGSGCTYCTDSAWEVKSANLP
jgi:hypothetical protein